MAAIGSTGALHPDLQQLAANADTYLFMSIAPSTRRDYDRANCEYKSFCQKYRLIPFPPAQQTLVLYATQVSMRSSHSNVKLHLSAIKHQAKILGFTVEFDKYLRLYLLLRGIKRAQGLRYALPKRRPITPDLLRTIKENLFRSFALYEDKLMLWAAIVCAFFGFLRVSEYTSTHKTKFDPHSTLLYQDLALSPDAASLRIKVSKTDPFRQGVYIRLARNNTALCPITALMQFLPHHRWRTGPLFTFQNGRYLTRTDVNSVLLSSTDGLASTSSHSLRIGAASTAAAAGCPKYLIKSLGRWSSDCFRRYIRVPDQTFADVSVKLADHTLTVPCNFNPKLL